jgi:hypothetical protein
LISALNSAMMNGYGSMGMTHFVLDLHAVSGSRILSWRFYVTVCIDAFITHEARGGHSLGSFRGH